MSKRRRKQDYKLSDYHLDIFYLVKLIHLYFRQNFTRRPLCKHINNTNMHWYLLSKLGWIDVYQKHNFIYLSLNKRGLTFIHKFIPRSIFSLKASILMSIIFFTISCVLSICLLPIWLVIIIAILPICYVYLLFLYYIHILPRVANNIRLDSYLNEFNPKLHKYLSNKKIIDNYRPFFANRW